MAKWKECEEDARKMNCWHCKTELIWGSDQDMDSSEYGEECPFDMVTVLNCPQCGSAVEVYHRKEGWQDGDED